MSIFVHIVFLSVWIVSLDIQAQSAAAASVCENCLTLSEQCQFSFWELFHLILLDETHSIKYCVAKKLPLKHHFQIF